MDDDTKARDADPARLPRFRFGLKTLFFITTALCLWLSYKFLRERRVTEIVARHEAVLSALDSQVGSMPVSRWHGMTPGRENQLLYERRATVLRVDHSDSTSSQKIAVDVSKLLDSKMHPTTIADQLVQFYGTHLVPLGFLQTLSNGDNTSYGASGVEFRLGAARGIWSSSNSDMNVIIDAQVFEPSKQAIVTILLLDSQQPNLWVDSHPGDVPRPAH